MIPLFLRYVDDAGASYVVADSPSLHVVVGCEKHSHSRKFARAVDGLIVRLEAGCEPPSPWMFCTASEIPGFVTH